MSTSRSGQSGRWRADSAGLRFQPGILVSFQRFIASAECVPQRLPPSLGALEPRGDGHGHFLIPLRRDEQLWVGILREADSPALHACGRPDGAGAVICEDGHRLDSRQPIAAGMTTIAAVCGDNGARLPFSLTGCCRLEFAALGEIATVELVDPESFTKRTGAPAPPSARSDQGYGGWRLP